MKKVAIIVSPGFEEGETLTIIDILRRGQIKCHSFGLGDLNIEGGHGIVLQCDNLFDEKVIDYDMIVLPGGYEGVNHMLESDLLIDILKRMSKENKWICAMCAAPVVLEKANLLKERNYTAYHGYDQKIHQGNYLEDIVVKDHHLITSRGPATVYAFTFALLKELGGDVKAVKERMLYNHAFDEGSVE